MARRYTQVFQFKITLKEIEPEIWRRIQVPANYSFWDLHVAIQDAMGWTDSHLHMFRILNPLTDDTNQIGIPDEDRFVGDPEILPGWELPITGYFLEGNPRAEYEYDFGDSWIHEITLETIAPRQVGAKYPRCLDGRSACPPEDCGGPPGYEDMLRILKNPDHEEHESMLTWVGRQYDPERFDPKDLRFDDPKKRWDTAFAM